MSSRQPIPAEIVDDGLARALERLAADEQVHTILAIGSSSGEGSTASLVAGLLRRTTRPHVFCLETSRERFALLQHRYAHVPEVHCYNAAAVPISEEMSEDGVRDFCLHHRPFYGAETALHWLRDGHEYIIENKIRQDGIAWIKSEHSIETFDVVLIDGGEFSGEAEWHAVDGACWVCLDDINVCKNWHNYQRLLHDPRYELIERDEKLRNGYAIFHRARIDLPIHFFTIVLNGEPFIERHIEQFQHLTVPWTWHIVEGAAALKHDTAWSVRNGGILDETFHRNGLSTDGTTEYLNALNAAFPENVKVYRRTGGGVFDGKIEMIRAVTGQIAEECLLWQIDSDEFWTAQQITTAHRMFMADASRTAAFYFCDFHVGPELVTTTFNTYASNLGGEWLRTWRYRPGMLWLRHEPPTLVSESHGSNLADVARINPFLHYETAAAGLVFRHEAYITEAQLVFKERYYGYRNALVDWRALQMETQFPVPLRRYFGWVNDETMVDRVETGAFSRRLAERRAQVLAERDAGRPGVIVIDGCFYQRSASTGIAQVWTNLLREWAPTEFARRLVVIDRGRTAPRIEGIEYVDLARHQYDDLELDRARVEDVCRFFSAGWFISTYYSRTLTTPTIFFAHDMIPERGWFDLKDPMWGEKALAIEQAVAIAGNSQITIDDLHHFYPGSRAKPTVVTSLASRLQRAGDSETALFRQRYGLNRPYWFMVGPSAYYKNCGYFFDALRGLRTRHAFDVVCASARGLDKWRGEFSIREFIFNDTDLAAAYTGAEALVFPSKVEGFGLPLVEAMNCGCPVIALDTPIHREVCGDAALYCPSSDPMSMAPLLAAVQVEATRQAQIERGYRRAKTFSWSLCAGRFRDLVETLDKERSTVPYGGTENAARSGHDRSQPLRHMRTEDASVYPAQTTGANP